MVKLVKDLQSRKALSVTDSGMVKLSSSTLMFLAMALRNFLCSNSRLEPLSTARKMVNGCSL